jgi:tetratricopeptide (TPR) repeat protein
MFIYKAKLILAIAFLIAASAIGGEIYAQKSPLWNELEAGAYSVGFQVIYKYDYSRTWKQKSGIDRQSGFGTNARPVRISVWYPAQKLSVPQKVFYRDYVFYKTANEDFKQADKLLEERDVSSLRHILINSEQVFNQLMTTQMAASFNAAHAKGNFPLVVYSSGLNDISSSNVVLCEYLASHGYVVVTVPQLATSSEIVNLGINPIDLETQTRDLEFALGAMHNFPNVDRNKLAVAGHSMGGVAALILQMRNTEVDAVIGLDASYGAKSLTHTLTQSPYYQSEKMQIPFLDMRRPSDEVNLSAVEAFRYSDRYFLRFPGIFHGDFTTFPMIALRFPTDIQDRTAETAARGYEAVCRYALNFLNAYLKRNSSGLSFIGNQPEANGIPENVVKYEFRKGLQPPPTEREFVEIVFRDGLPKAIELYRKFKSQEPEQPIINETILNLLGYGLIGSGQLAQAVNVFKLNIEAHPASANAYDSLAETYLRIGEKELALKFYKKALDVNPNYPNAKAATEVVKKLEAELKPN